MSLSNSKSCPIRTPSSLTSFCPTYPGTATALPLCPEEHPPLGPLGKVSFSSWVEGHPAPLLIASSVLSPLLATLCRRKTEATHNKKSSKAQQMKLPSLSEEPLETPKASTSSPSLSSKGLSRHLALSKKFAGTKSPARQEVLKAHYELRKSPRSFYTDAGSSTTEDIKSQSSTSTKLDLEALSQIFHNSSRYSEEGPPKKNPSRGRVCVANIANIGVNTEPLPPTDNAATKELTQVLEQLKSRLDTISVHMKQKDSEVLKMKENLIELQLMVLKGKKEDEECSELMQRLSRDMEALTNKLDLVENKLINQEARILNKLLLIEEMGGSSDSDSDYGRMDCKPSNWIPSSKSTSSTINPYKKPETAPKPCAGGAISSLKECTNWVPIAPDFDKLLNVIALLNFRMDRNQSMKLARNGNEATFKASL